MTGNWTLLSQISGWQIWESTSTRTCYTSDFHNEKDWKTQLLDSIFIFLFTEITLIKCCISNIGCQRSEVNYYDSIFTGSLKPCVKKQIASLVYETGLKITLHVKPVQSKVVHTQEKFWEHLIHCHHKGKLTSFPQDNIQRKPLNRAKPKSLPLELHCVWHLPWDNIDKANTVYLMAQCDKCSSWFHRKFAKIPDEVYEKQTNWHCHLCSVWLFHVKNYYRVTYAYYEQRQGSFDKDINITRLNKFVYVHQCCSFSVLNGKMENISLLEHALSGILFKEIIWLIHKNEFSLLCKVI